MSATRTLEEWLAHCERQHHKSVDTGLARGAGVWARMGARFEVPVITVAGTNGKGSTCAMLESVARQAGYRTALYIKPHLVHFKERCRVNGEPLTGAELVPHFEAVEAARDGTPLTWYEFTTLAVLRALALARADVVILEVGLGGRLDVVNLIDADCAVITSIDLDHMDVLGPDRESIGWEKAHIMRAGRPAIVGDPRPPQRLLDHGASIGADLRLAGRDFSFGGDRQQWNWAGRNQRFSGLGYPALRGANQLLNASAMLAAFEALRDRVPINAQAVRNGLAMVELPGRFQIVPGQPALVLDVAHNEQAVATLAVNLDAMGFYPRTHAVFGVMRDKALEALLPRMVPLVDAWHCTSLPTARAADGGELAEHVRRALARDLHLARRRTEVSVQAHADPAAALRAALAAADPVDRIVVFGSFLTVGGVLKEGLPRLGSSHGTAAAGSPTPGPSAR